MTRKRRTKKSYTDLFDNPESLFKNTRVLVWPNGQPEIWITNRNGTLGVRIEASTGPYGLGIHITSFAGTPPITMTNETTEDKWIDLCQYKQDERSQAFKDAYINGNIDKFFTNYPEERTVHE